jgi:palmitoyl-protein thioesterase
LAADKHFHGEFNVIGLSQGGLLARYIAEECDMPGRVRNLVTLGGPHMGVAAVPHCGRGGVVCSIVNHVAKTFVYWEVAQNWIAPAGYFRDVNNLKTYEEKSVFLPALNNEQDTTRQGLLTDMAALRKTRFADINQAMFVKFSEDTMIYPKETAWF